MEKSRVALVRCDEYKDELVYAAVKEGIRLLGGIHGFVKYGENIVLKPNVLIGTNPVKNVTTHPSVFKAAGKLLLEAGVKVSYGDSSFIGGCASNMKRANLKPIADTLGLTLADFDHGTEVSHKTALLNKKFLLVNGVLDADGVVSLPKFKTHGLTRFTGAIKNQFGCIPGRHKREFHLKMPDPFDFATMLVDINTFIRPRLFIMDGIIAMEGNGPYGGKPRKMNVLLFSSDPVALDSIACKLIDLNPEFVPTSKPGEKSGLGTYHYDNIDVTGDNPDSFISRDFKVVRKPPVPASGNRFVKFLKNQMSPRPVIDKTKCTLCGTCIEACPVGPAALGWGEDTEGKRSPRHKYSDCIRCYCCQETCPQGTISVKSPLLGKLVFGR